ncbi:MAG TPA: HEAT repeat domain-containing protein, partial [Urbifossiella sp.]
SAANEKEIDQAIKKGAAYLKAQFTGFRPQNGNGNMYGIGPEALSGIALLAARVPADDPSIKSISAAVREAAYSETKTYQLALCLIYLDQLGDAADIPLIQVLAVRLLAGQNAEGGWDYASISGVSPEQVQWLKNNLKTEELVAGKGAAKNPKDPKSRFKLHPDVQKYAESIQKNAPGPLGDNSNTQFAILGVWVSRKYGVPVEGALAAIEKRFRAAQDPDNFGWSYFPVGRMSSPSMTCCGLLGLATALARREERHATAQAPKEPAAKTTDKNDPFFSRTRPNGSNDAKRHAIRDAASQKAIDALGGVLAAYVKSGGILAPGDKHGDRDFYFMWSLERTGVIYNLEKFGSVNWYEVGANDIVKAQQQDGAWSSQSYGSVVNTSFAILFLSKADLARDLSSKFRNEKDSELRAGTSGGTPAGGGGDPSTTPPTKGPETGSRPLLPKPTESEASKIASQLLLASATSFTSALEKIRDAKGGDNTKALVIAIHRLDADRKKETREALAERLTRMSAETLKGMMTADDAELRRGAVLAGAMKDDKVHIPDLIDRLTDEEDLVVRAAKAALKSLTAQDFGPRTGATKEECKTAAAAWRAWWAKQK